MRNSSGWASADPEMGRIAPTMTTPERLLSLKGSQPVSRAGGRKTAVPATTAPTTPTRMTYEEFRNVHIHNPMQNNYRTVINSILKSGSVKLW